MELGLDEVKVEENRRILCVNRSYKVDKIGRIEVLVIWNTYPWVTAKSHILEHTSEAALTSAAASSGCFGSSPTSWSPGCTVTSVLGVFYCTMCLLTLNFSSLEVPHQKTDPHTPRRHWVLRVPARLFQDDSSLWIEWRGHSLCAGVPPPSVEMMVIITLLSECQLPLLKHLFGAKTVLGTSQALSHLITTTFLKLVLLVSYTAKETLVQTA